MSAAQSALPSVSINATVSALVLLPNLFELTFLKEGCLFLAAM